MRSAAYAVILTLSGTKRKDLRISLKSAICAFAIALTWATTTLAQVATGTPSFGSFSGGPDIVDNGNLNVHIAIPIVRKAGRGTPFTYILSYDTSVWFPSISSGTNTRTGVANWGLRGQTEVSTGYVSNTVTTAKWCLIGGVYYGTQFTYSNWTYHDTFGTPHAFSGSTKVSVSHSTSCPTSSTSLTATTTDGSGWTLSATGNTTNSVTSVGGQVLHPPAVNSQTGAGSFTDPNGNTISVSSSGVFTDTLGMSALTVTGSGTQASPLVYTYTAAGNVSQQITVKYTDTNIKTNFGCSGVAEYTASSVPLVTEIDLPNSTSYTFGYEATPGNPGYFTGRLISITLPTGGTISYTYTGGGSGNINCADGSAAGLQRTLNGAGVSTGT